MNEKDVKKYIFRLQKNGREKFSPCGQKLITEKVYLIKDNV